jgi:hypothetical protein
MNMAVLDVNRVDVEQRSYSAANAKQQIADSDEGCVKFSSAVPVGIRLGHTSALTLFVRS